MVLYCPEPSASAPPTSSAGANNGAENTNYPFVPPERARLVGKDKVVVGEDTYVSPFSEEWWDGTLQDLTPFSHLRRSSINAGKPWYDTSHPSLDYFRFESRGFWTRFGTNGNLAHAAEYGTGLGKRLFRHAPVGGIVTRRVPFVLRILGEPRFEPDSELCLLGEFARRETIVVIARNEFFRDNDVHIHRSNDQFWNTYIASGPAPNLAGQSELRPLFKVTDEADNIQWYTDHTFKMTIPFPYSELNELSAINFPAVEKHSQEYNFFVEEYERAIRGLSRLGLDFIIPSLHIFLAEKNNTRRVQGGSLYHFFITLGNSLTGNNQQFFVDVLNERGEKIGEKDYGDYFKKWSRHINRFVSLVLDNPEIQESDEYQWQYNIISRFKNVLFSPKEISLFKSYNEKRFLFPMHVNLEFSTDITTEVAEALKESELSIALMRTFLERPRTLLDHDTDPEGNFRWTRLWAPKEERIYTSTRTTFEDTTVGRLREIRRRKIPGEERVMILDLEEWWREFSSNGNSLYENLQFVSVHTDAAEQFDEAWFAGGAVPPDTEGLPPRGNDFVKAILSVIFSGRLKAIARNRLRSFLDIMSGELAYSETIFYKIVKYAIDDVTDEPTGDPIQQIFIPNSNELDVLTYFDTQVAAEVNYRYRVFAYELVFGSKYKYVKSSYSDDEFPSNIGNNGNDAVDMRYAKMDVVVKPSLRVVQVPFYEFDVKVVDKPPLPPEVDIIPYRSVNNRILFNFSAVVGERVAQPIALSAEEELRFTEILAHQNDLAITDGAIKFKGDDEIDFYEIYRITSKPESYSEFAEQLYTTVDSENYGARNIRSSAASFIETVLPNKKYYYIFRAVDIHGNFSNPTAVYEIELVDNDGAVYPLIRAIDFEQKEITQPSKSFKKYLQISPALNREELFIDDVSDEVSISGDLFVTEGQIPKRYKFRITSEQTGKKLDINVIFKHQHEERTDAIPEE